MFIYHTHPGGTTAASAKDRAFMDILAKTGSPQIKSKIIPVDSKTKTVCFTGN